MKPNNGQRARSQKEKADRIKESGSSKMTVKMHIRASMADLLFKNVPHPIDESDLDPDYGF
jgi:hypothetical protein